MTGAPRRARRSREPARLTAVGFLAAAALGVLSALHVGSSVAATAATPSARDTTTTLSGWIVIECDGSLRTLYPASSLRGDCTVSGAITDRGTFVDSAMPRVHPHQRTLSLEKGSIRISVYRERGNWKIIGGSNAYTGLRGRGWEKTSSQRCAAGPNSCSVLLTMNGRVFG